MSVPGAAMPRRSGGSKPIEWFRRVAPKRGSGDREMVIVLRASAFDDECFPFPKQKLKQAFINICAPDFGIDRIMSNSSYPDLDELMCWPDGVRSLSKGTAHWVDFESSDSHCDIGGFAEAWNKDTRVQACCLMAICDRIVRQRCESDGGYLWSDGDLEKEVVGLSRIVEVAIREYGKAEADNNSGADDGEEASKLQTKAKAPAKPQQPPPATTPPPGAPAKPPAAPAKPQKLRTRPKPAKPPAAPAKPPPAAPAKPAKPQTCKASVGAKRASEEPSETASAKRAKGPPGRIPTTPPDVDPGPASGARHVPKSQLLDHTEELDVGARHVPKSQLKLRLAETLRMRLAARDEAEAHQMEPQQMLMPHQMVPQQMMMPQHQMAPQQMMTLTMAVPLNVMQQQFGDVPTTVMAPEQFGGVQQFGGVAPLVRGPIGQRPLDFTGGQQRTL